MEVCLFYIIVAMVGSGSIYCISILIGNNDFIEYLGKYSIIILCTHEQIKRVVIMISGKVTDVPHEELRNQIVAGLLIAVVVLVIELAVIQVCRTLAQIFRGTKLE